MSMVTANACNTAAWTTYVATIEVLSRKGCLRRFVNWCDKNGLWIRGIEAREEGSEAAALSTFFLYHCLFRSVWFHQESFRSAGHLPLLAIMRTVTLCNLFCFVICVCFQECRSNLNFAYQFPIVSFCTVAFSFGNWHLISESTLLWLKVQGLLILSSKPACRRRRPMNMVPRLPKSPL